MPGPLALAKLRPHRWCSACCSAFPGPLALAKLPRTFGALKLFGVFQGRWPWLNYGRTFGARLTCSFGAFPSLTYNPSMPGFFEVMIERNFSSAHQLRGYKGKCENLHGHNYKIEIYARGEELNNIGLLIDFVDLKAAADEIVKYLDHRNINELPPFDEELNPSAENLAKYILEYLNGRVADERVQVYKVRCFETPTSVATYQIV